MARDLRLDISGDASRARQALAAAEDSVGKLRRETNRLEHEFAQTNREAAALDRQLLETAAATKLLNAEFAKTGDRAVLAQIRAQKSELSQITQVRKEYNATLKDGRLAQIANHEAAIAALKAEYLLFAPSKVKAEIRERQNSIRLLKNELGDLADEASVVGKVLGATLGKLPDLLGNIPGLGLLSKAAGNPAVGAIAASVAVPAVIGAGATIGGAVGGGVGAGAAGLAVAGAAMQSQAVHRAWSVEIAGIKREFLDATKSSVEPTIGAIHRVGEAIRGIHLDSILGKAAEFIEPLSRGTAAGIAAIGRGIDRLVSRAGPEVQAIADGVAGVGRAIEKAFDAIADGSEGGAKALDDFFRFLATSIVVFGQFIGATEDAYNALDKFANKLADVHPTAGLARWFQGDGDPKVVARRLDDTKNSIDGVSGALSDMTSEANLANQAFDRLFGIMMSVDNANLQVKEGFVDLTKASKDHGVSQDEITAKVLRQIQALQDQRNAQLATGDGSQAATDRINANYNAQLEQLKKMFPWLAALIQKYEDLAKPLTKHIDIIIQEKRIGSVSVEGVISGGDQRRSTGKGFASGTRSAPPGLAWVGEAGRPELVDFRGGERVYNPSESAMLMRGYRSPASYFAAMTGPAPARPMANGASLPPLSVIEQALAAIIVKLARNGQLPLSANSAG